MKKNKSETKLALIACAAALSACGGGGGSDNPAAIAAAEGVYGGTLTGSTYPAFELLVLENGDFWSMYGIQGSSGFSVAGFVQGTGISNNGTFTAAQSKDFGYSPALAVSTNASYDPTAKTISGTLTAATGAVRFSGGPIAGSLYNYNTAATQSTVAGAWSATSLSGERVALTVSAGGAFTATSSAGCGFSGSVTPRASGKNVFNVALTFGASPCALPGQTATGIALAYPLASGQTQLVVAVTDATRTYGSGLIASR